jgi:TP901 family phage tail tape measure protein
MKEEIDIDITGNYGSALDELIKDFKTLKADTAAFQNAAVDSMDKIAKRVKSINLIDMHQGFQNVSAELTNLSVAGLDFNSSMGDLQAITGLTGSDLDNLGQKARNNAKEFGGNAAKSLESYKLLLSQLTPELAKQPAALDAMARNVSILSKTMGGDTIAATEVLTTAMNQYGVSMDDPVAAAAEMTNMMNIMAAAAKEGSAELPVIKQAIENVGGQAKLSGLEFAEMNSAIQALDKAGKKGAEGGTALRSILTKLGQGRFLPEKTAEELRKAGIDVSALADKNVSFTDKMRMLQPVLAKDSELINTLFGEYGQAAASLITTADAQDAMTKATTGTNTAVEQSKAIMETHAEKVSRMQASIEDAKISFFEATGGMTAYLGPVTEILKTVSAFAPVYSAAKTAILAVATAEGRAAIMSSASKAASIASTIATKAVTAAQWLWNAALSANPIGLVIGAVVALSAAVYAVSKAFGSSTLAEQANAAVKARVIEKTAEESAEVHILFERLRNAKKGTDEYSNTLKDLDEKYPGIIKKYQLHKGELEGINRAENDLIKSIQARAEIETNMELYKESQLKRKKLQSEGPSGLAYVVNATGGGKSMHEAEILAAKALEDEYFNKVLKDQKKLDKERRKSVKASGDGTAVDTGSVESAPSPLVTSGGYGSKKTPGVTQGAGEVKVINVHIDHLGGDITLNSTTVTENLAQLRKMFNEMFVSAVRDFEVAM